MDAKKKKSGTEGSRDDKDGDADRRSASQMFIRIFITPTRKREGLTGGLSVCVCVVISRCRPPPPWRDGQRRGNDKFHLSAENH